MATFGTFVSGQVLTAAELNGAGSWQSYTPTFTQSATITKTVNWARYTQLNKWVQGSIKMTASSSGTANNKILVGLPVNASANNFLIGRMTFNDSSATGTKQIFSVDVFYESASTMSFYPYGTLATPSRLVVGAEGNNNNLKRFGENFNDSNGNAVTGLTVATGDEILIQFSYEAA